MFKEIEAKRVVCIDACLTANRFPRSDSWRRRRAKIFCNERKSLRVTSEDVSVHG